VLLGRPVLAEQVPFGVAFQDRGYTWIGERDGVTVYKHQTASEIRLGAEVQLPAAPEQVMATLLDYPSQVGHIKRLSESRVLAHRQGWLQVYQRLNISLLSDRDFTLQVTWGRDREVSWIKYSAIGDGPPRRRGGGAGDAPPGELAGEAGRRWPGEPGPAHCEHGPGRLGAEVDGPDDLCQGAAEPDPGHPRAPVPLGGEEGRLVSSQMIVEAASVVVAVCASAVAFREAPSAREQVLRGRPRSNPKAVRQPE